ncbi:hypothetical protein [Clostridium lacusfryxellense]|nr:hypothetical protein [Clostridium lacusfryxellense]
MKNENKNISEMSKNTSIFITLCVVACVLAIVGVKIVLTTM